MTVIDLERRTVERLALELEPGLMERGTLVADVQEIGNVERWRRAARLAGRRVGFAVRTMVSSDGSTVFAFLNQRVAPGEQAAAANQVAAYIFGRAAHLRVLTPEDKTS